MRSLQDKRLLALVRSLEDAAQHLSGQAGAD
jgi:hypothetical protein